MGTLAALGIWLVELTRIRVSAIGGYGFISAVDALFFIAVALLSISFCAALAQPAPRSWLLTGQVAVLIVMLHGTALIVEPLANFSTTWLHAGFTDYIARTGRTLPFLDARFDWAGFFSAAAMLTRAAGLKNPLPLLRFAPLFFEFLYAVAVYALAGTATNSQQTRWIAVWFTICVSWVGQDYFSPQAMALFLALAVLLIVLRWFKASPLNPATRWSKAPGRLWRLAPDELRAESASSVMRARLMVAALMIFAAIVMSHQLTPVVVVASLAALALTRRLAPKALPVTFAVMFTAFVSYATVSYWSGHLADVFGSVGQLSASLNENIGQRVSGSSSRLFVQEVRIGLTGALVLFAGVGFVRRLRRGYGDLTLVILGFIPFSVLGVQSYGGEALLRALTFGTPFLAILAAFAFMPGGKRATVAYLAVLVPLTLALSFAFLIARFGNNAWDRVTPDEFAALQYTYDHAPTGSLIVPIASNGLGYGYRDLERFQPFPQSDRDVVSTLRAAEGQLDRPGHTYLIVTRGQEEFGELYIGLPAHWGFKLIPELQATGRYRVIFSNHDASVVTRIDTGSREPPK